MARILIVDDEPHIQALIRALLKAAGHETVTAEDRLKALETIDRHAFDLIITDLRMPNMDGLTFLRKVQALAPTIPAILITAYTSNETAIEAFKFGAFDYLAKPFKINELLSVVDRALASGRNERQGTNTYTGDNPAIKAYLQSLRVARK